MKYIIKYNVLKYNKFFKIIKLILISSSFNKIISDTINIDDEKEFQNPKNLNNTNLINDLPIEKKENYSDSFYNELDTTLKKQQNHKPFYNQKFFLIIIGTICIVLLAIIYYIIIKFYNKQSNINPIIKQELNNSNSIKETVIPIIKPSEKHKDILLNNQNIENTRLFDNEDKDNDKIVLNINNEKQNNEHPKTKETTETTSNDFPTLNPTEEQKNYFDAHSYILSLFNKLQQNNEHPKTKETTDTTSNNFPTLNPTEEQKNYFDEITQKEQQLYLPNQQIFNKELIEKIIQLDKDSKQQEIWENFQINKICSKNYRKHYIIQEQNNFFEIRGNPNEIDILYEYKGMEYLIYITYPNNLYGILYKNKDSKKNSYDSCSRTQEMKLIINIIFNFSKKLWVNFKISQKLYLKDLTQILSLPQSEKNNIFNLLFESIMEDNETTLLNNYFINDLQFEKKETSENEYIFPQYSHLIFKINYNLIKDNEKYNEIKIFINNEQWYKLNIIYNFHHNHYIISLFLTKNLYKNYYFNFEKKNYFYEIVKFTQDTVNILKKEELKLKENNTIFGKYNIFFQHDINEKKNNIDYINQILQEKNTIINTINNIYNCISDRIDNLPIQAINNIIEYFQTNKLKILNNLNFENKMNLQELYNQLILLEGKFNISKQKIKRINLLSNSIKEIIDYCDLDDIILAGNNISTLERLHGFIFRADVLQNKSNKTEEEELNLYDLKNKINYMIDNIETSITKKNIIFADLHKQRFEDLKTQYEIIKSI